MSTGKRRNKSSFRVGARRSSTQCCRFSLRLFPYSGNYNYGGGVNNQGSNGNWWSRSAYTTAGQAYNFNLNTNGNVNPQNNNNVGNGFAVRCVAE